MASENLGLIQPVQRLDNSLNSQLAYHEDTNLRFGRGVGDPGPKTTRELTGFIDDRYFQTQGPEFRRSLYGDATPDRQDHQNRQDWNNNERVSNTPSGDGSDGDDDDDEDDDDDDDVNGLVAVDNNSNKNNSSNNSGHSTASGDNSKAKNHLSSLGSNRGVLVKEGNVLASININNSMRASSSENHAQQGQGRIGNFQGPVTIADPEGELYYSHYLQGPDSSASGQKDMVDSGGFSGRKDGTSYSNESGDSLRVILSDPLTGALMDDAMILPCGHSFSRNGGIQHVIRMKACYTCSQPVSEDAVAPNLSLRVAVQAFRREEELQGHRASKKRKERFEQEKGSHGDSTHMDPRSRGVQFPFTVTDRVIIKGNKRTPQRFVGREAVVTTQCLNGWYVVKTLDNAESVKLQYRSLSKVPDNINTNNTTINPTSNPTSSSKITPTWL